MKTKKHRNIETEGPRNQEHFLRFSVLLSLCARSRAGQALVGLLSFMAIIVIVISAAVVVTLINTQTTSGYALSERLFTFGESGAEDATLRLLRNPDFTNSTTTYGVLNPTMSVIIGVSGASSKTITINAQFDGMVRKFQTTGSFSGTVFTLSTWQELP